MCVEKSQHTNMDVLMHLQVRVVLAWMVLVSLMETQSWQHLMKSVLSLEVIVPALTLTPQVRQDNLQHL